MHENPSIAILGATGGVGRALSRRLEADGARLFLGARNKTAVSELATELEARLFEVDGTDFSRMDEFLDWASADGDLQAVVNCAGSLLLKPAHRTTFEDRGESDHGIRHGAVCSEGHEPKWRLDRPCVIRSGRDRTPKP